MDWVLIEEILPGNKHKPSMGFPSWDEENKSCIPRQIPTTVFPLDENFWINSIKSLCCNASIPASKDPTPGRNITSLFYKIDFLLETLTLKPKDIRQPYNEEILPKP